MAINKQDIFKAVRGTIFMAPAETPLPDDPSQFTLTTEKVGEWENMGHTSNDNRIEFSFDGGEPTTYDTWLEAGVQTTYSTSTLTFTGNSVQGDKDNLQLIYNGWLSSDQKMIVATLEKRAVDKAFFILAHDSGNNVSFGLYLPNVSFTFNDMPNFTSDDNFAEFGFSGTVKSSTVLPKGPNGVSGAFGLLPPESFKTTETVPVTGVTIDKPTLTVAVGADDDLTVTIQPANASDKTGTWTSADTKKATVTPKTGNPLQATVHGVAATDSGKTVDITFTSTDGAKTVVCKATVNNA